jgi:regulator of replication initiation timing
MNLSLIQSLSALSGLIVSGTGFIVVIVGSFYLVKSGLGKTVNRANQDAITALGATILALQADSQRFERKIDELTKENSRLKLTMDTVRNALKTRGLMVTIDGEMVIIDSLDSKSSTVTRIEKQNGQ